MPNQIRSPRRLGMISLLLVVLVSLLTEGCAPNWIGRYNKLAFCRTKRVRNPIWESYDEWYEDLRYWVQEDLEEELDFPGPLPSDLRPPEGDYILGSRDLLRITIQDLYQPNAPYFEEVRVTQGGNVTLPYVGRVKASGRSAAGLEQRLKDMYSPDPLADPNISVFVTEYRNQFFYVMGAVNQPGMYPLVTTDMELLHGLAQAGGISPFAEDMAYLSRRFTPEELNRLLLESFVEEEEPEAEVEGEAGEAEESSAAGEGVPEPKAEADKPKQLTPLEELKLLAEGRTPPVDEGQDQAPEAEQVVEPEVEAPEPPSERKEDQDKWKFVDGKWVEVEKSAEAESEAGQEAEMQLVPEEGFAISELPESLQKKLARLGVIQGGEGLRRIIRIDVRAALQLDPTQNPVLRNGDILNVPEPPAGEWYIDGEVVRRGVYSLTGRKITLLQAIAAAGGLTEVAIPKRTELVRRVSENEEEIIYVDLEKIAKGEAPDFFLQPDDLIRVGTDQGAIWLAVLRNAFRATYGFGLVYDQNFADIYPFRGDFQPLFGRN
ncbi:MAG: hypothetical protein GWP05_00370 [Anaerolineaceae bacterium]|nr:hypothetical protein [Anaerolineaceae bacterium]